MNEYFSQKQTKKNISSVTTTKNNLSKVKQEKKE